MKVLENCLIFPG